MKDWTIIGLGVISAVIAAIFVGWMDRTFNAPTGTANDAAWNQRLGTQVLPNYNLAPDSPAWTYQSGAPVTRENARAADPEIGTETGNSAELRTGECAEKFVQFAAEAERWENFGRWWIFRRRIGRRHGWRPEELQQNSGLL